MTRKCRNIAVLLAIFVLPPTVMLALLEPAEQEHAVRAILFLLPTCLTILLAGYLLVRGILAEWDQ